jgi:hypothetical protein
VDIVTYNQQTLQCKVLTDSEQTVEDRMDIVTHNQQTVQCVVLTDSRQNVEEYSGHSDVEPTDSPV